MQGTEPQAPFHVGTRTAFGPPPDEFARKLVEVKQRQPLRIVSVIIGDGAKQAETFSDHVVQVVDLLHDREQLRGAVADIVRIKKW